MRRVLLTGGRAPATLDLARLLHVGGCEVHLAESMRASVTGWSSAVRQVHRVPKPRQQTSAYLRAMVDIVERHRIDRVVPTCEEVFWTARGRPDLPVFCPPLTQLRRLHSKALFVECAAKHGLAVPETVRVCTRDQAWAAIDRLGGPQRVVLKPEFSRFSTSTLVRPSPRQCLQVSPSSERPWVVQRALDGSALCTWSVAQAGRITAHTCYNLDFSAGQGSAIRFGALRHPGARAWVEAFVAAEELTGMVAFDFFDVDGHVTAIECNPRLTSGVHLLNDANAVVRAFFEPDAPVVEPAEGACAQLAAPMLLYGLPQAVRRGDVGSWWRAFRSSREVSWSAADVRPFLLQGVSIAALTLTALRHREGLLDATTHDIRWDGEKLPGSGEQPTPGVQTR